MKCEDCCHAEMCKWIDELEGRGCDFLSQGQISLDDINNAIEASFRNGVRSAKVEQEPCDDAISRKDVINAIDKWISEYKPQHYLIQSIRELPSVTQKSGKWIEQIDHEENCRTLICSNCDRPALHDGDSIWVHKFCPHCGAKMESEDKK